MYEYMPQMLKEVNEARREDMIREAAEERKANKFTKGSRNSFIKHVRSLVVKIFP